MTRTEHEVLRICALAHRKLDELGYPPVCRPIYPQAEREKIAS